MTQQHTNDGNPAQPEQDSLAKTRANRAFTLAARRLAASPECLNCGTVLKGPYCHFCGQPDKNLMRFFPVLARDLLADVFDFDSRFMRTIKPLLFHPGKLTRDYLDGRRSRYVPPLRLYLFSSMAFFILAAMLTGPAIQVTGSNPESAAESSIHLDPQALADELQEAVRQGTMTAEDAKKIDTLVENAAALKDTSTVENVTETPDSLMVNGKPWNRETNPFVVPFMPAFINERINRDIEESPQKGREIKANPNLIVDKIFDILPVAVFVMLPLVALLFKICYLFAGKYYVEHLIHALHNHAFLFVIFSLTLLIRSLAPRLDSVPEGTLTQLSSWLTTALLCWIPFYLLFSLKTVYRQGWLLTWSKFSLLGFCYMLLLAFVSIAAAVLSFVLL